VIAPDGHLILGAAETTIGLSQAFKAIAERRGLYAPVDPQMSTADRVATRLAVAGTQLASRL
jgi:chemotaxis protein methyltransferase CheR